MSKTTGNTHGYFFVFSPLRLLAGLTQVTAVDPYYYNSDIRTPSTITMYITDISDSDLDNTETGTQYLTVKNYIYSYKLHRSSFTDR